MRLCHLLIAVFGGISCAEIVHLLEKRADWTVGQTVQTSSGPVSGKAASNQTGVSEYLGIPFAKPPVGDLRFAPPERYSGSSSIDGTKYGPSCPATQRFGFTEEKFAAANVSEAGVQFLQSFAQAGDTFSEDCLTVNVWTKPQVGESKKAVLVWIYGGGFSVGNSDNGGYNGQYIVDREDVILVSFNYRLNIFGFPGSPSTSQNLGLLDQRLALEWVRDNIEQFGGDLSRITLFGQSAGGASVDYYSFAWTSDPIVSAFIPQSGTAVASGQLTASESSELWYKASSDLGCGTNTTDSETVLACMRNITDFKDIINSISESSGGTSLGGFGPTIDDKVVFSNYLERGLAGNFNKAPILVGVADFEGGLFQLIAEIAGTPLPQSVWEGVFQDGFNCGAALRANISVYHKLPVWRYRWYGTYPNTNLSTSKNYGAYHASEIPIIFGVPPFGGSVPENTPAEIDEMKYMTGAWAAFAKDPVNGLKSGNYGWPEYQPSGQSLIRLAFEDSVEVSFANGLGYDKSCMSKLPITGNGNGTIPGNNSSTTVETGSPTTLPTSTSSGPPVTSVGERCILDVGFLHVLLFILFLRGL